MRFAAWLAAGVAIWLAACGCSFAQDTSLLPKYGNVPRTEAQRAAEREFVDAVNLQSGGDLPRAAGEFAMRGWQAANQRQTDEAMRRFNQAWTLDRRCALALWGMAALQVNLPGKSASALPLFAEAQKAGANEINFLVDYAKAVSTAAVETHNDALMQDALARFARIYAKAPRHMLNLQNWAVALFYAGDYELAWKKVKLAEATPQKSQLDARFLAALQSRMPRP
ncbi:MAG: hypothetical protein H7346_08815 [Burkholderiaceae bacterium]|nr:hypothetical protein [Burkholderiaceae bacterium]